MTYLTVEYKKMLFTKQPIDSLTDNSVERLKVNLTKQSLDNRIYKSNPQNSNFGDLPFDSDERWIDRQRLYHIKDDIVLRLINSLIVYV